MAPKKRKVAVSKHLICCNCSSWVHFVSSGCGKTWAETRGLRVEDKGKETESRARVTKTGANQESEEAAGNVRTEEMITGVEDEGEIRIEERKDICDGTPLMATHAYTKNQESPVGKEIYLRQWDTLIFKGQHADNEHWSLVEDRNGEVGYAPEGSRKQYRGKPDWTGGRTKEELFSGSDRWHQEKHYDLRWRVYHPENRFKTEQGGGRSRVFTGSKNRACDRERE